MSESSVALQSISKSFQSPSGSVHAVREISFQLIPGEFAALVGPSGCGKSTLLNIIGLADAPTSGSLRIAGPAIDFSSEGQLTLHRRKHLGYVFQHFNLLPTLSALENVMLPLLLLGVSASVAAVTAKEVLKRVGLAGRENALPLTLSGGEMQRVAVARAVVHQPTLIVADEPTGNLDSVAGGMVLQLLADVASTGTAVLMATHSDAAVQRCSRVIRLQDGVMVTPPGVV
jgi:putative ABC transport system ATP-binding protein